MIFLENEKNPEPAPAPPAAPIQIDATPLREEVKEKPVKAKRARIESKPLEKTSEEKTEKPAKKTSKPAVKLKITRFDKAVAEEVSRGVYNKKVIQEKLRVDAAEFEKRLETLLRQGYFVKDAANENIIRFGIKGFNAFVPKIKKEEAREAAPGLPPTPPATASEAIPASSDPLQKTLELNAPATSEKKIDLSELLAKGAPTNSLEKKISVELRPAERMTERIPAPKNAVELSEVLKQGAKAEGNALRVGGEEACELCKKKFRLTVGKSAGGKFGHCFCGAAFHKDCYETLLENSGKCIRCGRKLELKLDKKSQDAVKEIKELF